MGQAASTEFSNLLDDLIAAAEAVEPAVSRPAMPVDFILDAIEGSRVSPTVASAEYFDALDVLDRIKTEEPEEDQPSVDPQAIAGELGLLESTEVRDYDRLRRDFAFRNHPDRVAAAVRDRAVQRMQIANRLIDDAKQRALMMARGARA